jgi:hypothetical protein
MMYMGTWIHTWNFKCKLAIIYCPRNPFSFNCNRPCNPKRLLMEFLSYSNSFICNLMAIHYVTIYRWMQSISHLKYLHKSFLFSSLIGIRWWTTSHQWCWKKTIKETKFIDSQLHYGDHITKDIVADCPSQYPFVMSLSSPHLCVGMCVPWGPV